MSPAGGGASKRRRDPTGGTLTSPLYDRDIGRPTAWPDVQVGRPAGSGRTRSRAARQEHSCKLEDRERAGRRRLHRERPTPKPKPVKALGGSGADGGQRFAGISEYQQKLVFTLDRSWSSHSTLIKGTCVPAETSIPHINPNSSSCQNTAPHLSPRTTPAGGMAKQDTCAMLLCRYC